MLINRDVLNEVRNLSLPQLARELADHAEWVENPHKGHEFDDARVRHKTAQRFAALTITMHERMQVAVDHAGKIVIV